jgi:hypothetical protein
MTARELLLARVTGELRFCERRWQGGDGAAATLRRELGSEASVVLLPDRLEVALPFGGATLRVSVARRCGVGGLPKAA